MFTKSLFLNFLFISFFFKDVVSIHNIKCKQKIRFREMPPYCEEFIRKYIEIERSQVPSDPARVARGYEDALKHFGKNKIGKIEFFIKTKLKIAKLFTLVIGLF